VRHIAMVCRPADAENRRIQAVLEAFHLAVRERYADDPNVRPEKPLTPLTPLNP